MIVHPSFKRASSGTHYVDWSATPAYLAEPHSIGSLEILAGEQTRMQQIWAELVAERDYRRRIDEEMAQAEVEFKEELKQREKEELEATKALIKAQLEDDLPLARRTRQRTSGQMEQQNKRESYEESSSSESSSLPTYGRPKARRKTQKESDDEWHSSDPDNDTSDDESSFDTQSKRLDSDSSPHSHSARPKQYPRPPLNQNRQLHPSVQRQPYVPLSYSANARLPLHPSHVLSRPQSSMGQLQSFPTSFQTTFTPMQFTVATQGYMPRLGVPPVPGVMPGQNAYPAPLPGTLAPLDGHYLAANPHLMRLPSNPSFGKI
ncbi:hypothetical protein BLNAU_17407 [Blattamonas nauphoetae]|uniref:Uncharacterized protein n=1 Tax=Blattamonas nauphoetae TaxID=2049346 RepID=A0ABQ9X8Z2_9EUKA|nr:hypothetical protein BLNAU_17407 [Blattamonas nauphoetae]